MKEGLFLAVALLTVGFAVYSAASRNLIYSAFALLASLSGVAGLYLFLSGDFLAAIQILVYVGGVMVLFLFALMVTAGIETPSISNPLRLSLPAALVIVPFLAVAGFFIYNITQGFSSVSDSYAPVTASIGRSLLEKHMASFEILSILLLVALLGAIAVVRRTMVRTTNLTGAAASSLSANGNDMIKQEGDRA